MIILLLRIILDDIILIFLILIQYYNLILYFNHMLMTWKLTRVKNPENYITFILHIF